MRAIVAAAWAALAFQRADAVTPHDGMTLTFAADFRHAEAIGDGLSGWTTALPHGNRTLAHNHEGQFYVDATLGIDPFKPTAEGLSIIAARATQAGPSGLPYTSGVITTEHAFAQLHGYFEMRARLPAGAGLWPAFWLLPKGGGWPPEIDIMELLGQDPRRIYVSVHTRAEGRSFDVTKPVSTSDVSGDFHVFGMQWQPDTIRWYVDDVEVKALATPAGLTMPMFVLINLAVGGAGSWPGAPGVATVFPAVMLVSWVRVYK